MKYRVLALILALTVVTWAQTATQSTPSTPEQSAPDKGKRACCDKTASADAKDCHASCMQKHGGKEMASCCSGKEQKSCCEGKDAASCMKEGKMAESCCKGKDGTKCDRKANKDFGKGCCGPIKSEKTA